MKKLILLTILAIGLIGQTPANAYFGQCAVNAAYTACTFVMSMISKFRTQPAVGIPPVAPTNTLLRLTVETLTNHKLVASGSLLGTGVIAAAVCLKKLSSRNKPAAQQPANVPAAPAAQQQANAEAAAPAAAQHLAVQGNPLPNFIEAQQLQIKALMEKNTELQKQLAAQQPAAAAAAAASPASAQPLTDSTIIAKGNQRLIEKIQALEQSTLAIANLKSKTIEEKQSLNDNLAKAMADLKALTLDGIVVPDDVKAQYDAAIAKCSSAIQ